MASHPPPFQVEDNTDEAFFDELVNDEFDVDHKSTTSPASKGRSPADGNESDDAKAISNLSIHEDEHKEEVHWEHQETNWEADWDNQRAVDDQGRNDDGEGWEHQFISELENKTNEDFGAEMETAEHVQGGNEFGTDKKLQNSKLLSQNSGGSMVSEVKEVDWSAFDTASANNDSSGLGSFSDFFNQFGGEKDGGEFGSIVKNVSNHEHVYKPDNVDPAANWQCNGEYSNGYAEDPNSNAYDLSMIQQWESQYPGWKYDPNTGQWYPVEDYDAATSLNAAVVSNLSADWNQASQMSHAAETTSSWNQVSPEGRENNGIPSDWNHAPCDNNGYLSHMVFDPQYPGWYYDTIAMEWRSLESYYASIQSSAQGPGQMNQGTLESYSASVQAIPHFQGHMNQGVLESFSVPSQPSAQVRGQMNHTGYDPNQAGLMSNYYEQEKSGMQTAQAVGSSPVTKLYNGNAQSSTQYWQNAAVSTPASQQNSVSLNSPITLSVPGSQQDSGSYGVKGLYHDSRSQDQNKFSRASLFDAGGNLIQQFNDSEINQNSQKEFSNDYYGSQRNVNFATPQVQNSQISYASASGRSSAGRPAHALVAFGFGGKLVVMRSSSTVNMNFGSQDSVGGTISILNLGEVVNDVNTSDRGMGPSSYFQALCRQSLPGPLTSGSVGTKELNKWIDERIATLELTHMGHGKAEGLSLLLSLLKIACQYYGKLRSPYGTDAELKESDAPHLAVARLFSYAKGNGSKLTQYGVAAQCLQYMPSDEQLQVTAAEVQNLLVSGRKKDALQCAQDGQFWGFALVLAAQLGNQFYSETVKKMALQHMSAGSPLRTLCLLIANQPADVFSVDNTASSNMPGALNMPPQTAQVGANVMLDDWEENLAVITANRTKDDELVLIHLGDCLWKDRSNIIAAHICYLVAEANFEPYSDSARLCLVGADHWKFPRTFACPEAIQRTEIYEYSKTLGNSQFVLLPFQPYKFMYALMLAEVGKMSEAAKYCQSILKSLKNGRNPEVETLRHLVSSLEERIKAHQQGGFYANLAPKEFIGKLLKVFDSTAHRVVGGLPPTGPSAVGTLQSNKDHHRAPGHRVSSSQSTMAMSSLVPSQSMEPISDFAASNRTVKHARSASEPDFGRSPMKGRSDSLKKESPPGGHDKSSAPGPASSYGGLGFGTKLFQKTFGFVLKNRRQAKLGESNKFYYDEKLKRWVEEGAEPPAEEAAPPPPPIATAFQNGASDYSLKSALQNESSLSRGNQESKPPGAPENNPGIPPLPPTTNQYSARGRMGVRSRYVDTFNKGGGNATTTFQSPVVPSIKPVTAAGNPKFFVPAPAPVSNSAENSGETPANNTWENTSSNPEHFSSPPQSDSFMTPVAPPTTIPRHPSMNSIERTGDSGSTPVRGRRTVSWSGSPFDQSFSPTPNPIPATTEVKPLGEVLGLQTSSELLADCSSSNKDGSVVDDLHEVEL
ncbi:protein transport protein SEC16B homolog [Andrographis paniculata]|uniref:protein transport protein SEC16B homolog n=1 Tax=Andrographis paniculata TaxID=175694 RepID=UPI0021E9A293|nr:protein transport protein SEC16B homolog [Andrographis paniculata]